MLLHLLLLLLLLLHLLLLHLLLLLLPAASSVISCCCCCCWRFVADCAAAAAAAAPAAVAAAAALNVSNGNGFAALCFSIREKERRQEGPEAPSKPERMKSTNWVAAEMGLADDGSFAGKP